MTTKQDGLALSPDDLEMDVETVVARIRESLVARAVEHDVEYPTYAVALARSGGKLTCFPEELYYQLEQANLSYQRVLAELSVVESRTPLVGRFITRFKRELHRLVAFYVNQVAERQVTVNDAVVQTLNHLVDRLESRFQVFAGESGIDSLQRQVSELQERVESLEAQLNRTGTSK